MSTDVILFVADAWTGVYAMKITQNFGRAENDVAI